MGHFNTFYNMFFIFTTIKRVVFCSSPIIGIRSVGYDPNSTVGIEVISYSPVSTLPTSPNN